MYVRWLVFVCCAFLSFACSGGKKDKHMEPTTYHGHGIESVDAATLKRFAPKPAPESVRRLIERILDVRHDPFDIVLSPDRQKTFFSWNITGVFQVWRQDAPDTFPVQLTAGTETAVMKDLVAGGLIVYEKDRNGEENPGVYLMNGEGGEPIVVQHLPRVRTSYVGATPDRAAIYIRCNDAALDSYRILRYEIASKKLEVIFDKPGLWSVADVANDGLLLLVRETGHGSREYWKFDTLTKKLDSLFGQNEKADYEAKFGRSSTEVVVQTTKFSDFSRLYVFTERQFTQLSPDVPYEVDEFGLPRNRSYVSYVTNERGYLRLHRIDLEKRVPLLDPVLPAGVVLTTARSFSPDGRFSVLHLDWDTQPATNVLYDWQTHTMQYLMRSSMPETNLLSFSGTSLVEIPVRDGTTIPAFVRQPRACIEGKTGPCPVIVSYHGGPEGQSLPGFDTTVQVWLNAGYIVIQPNVRGSTGYGKTYRDADNGVRRLEVITDIEDVAHYVKKTYTRNGKTPKIGIFGGSYGGYLVLMAMTKFAGSYDVGVSIVGIANLVTFLKNTAPYRLELRKSEYGDPVTDYDALVKLSPTTFADRVKGPLLLIQGATDPRVPVGEALTIYEAVRGRVPSELIIFPDEGHGMRKRHNVVQAYADTVRWFDEYLKK